MIIKIGYTQTDIGVIPEDWEVKEVRHIVEKSKISSGIYKDKNLYGQGSKIIKLGDVFGHDFFIPELAQKVKLTKKELLLYQVKIGDIFIALASVKLEGVGKVMLVNSLDEETAYDHNVALIRVIDGIDAKYIRDLFKANTVRNQIANKATQVGTTFLKSSTILSFQIPIPPLTEQTAIAAALSDVDALIGELDKLIAKKRDIKQATMQQLLTGKKRLAGFSGEWEVKRLGEVGFTYGGITGKTKNDFYCGASQYIPFLNIIGNVVIDVENLEQVNISASERQNQVKKGDLFFNGSSETPEEVGMCAVLLDDLKNVYLNSFCFGFRLFEAVKMDELFLAYFFRSGVGRSLLYFLAQGATRYNLSKTNFLKLEILIPTQEEQTAIATILSDMDAEINALQQKREKTAQLKQGMMQELLTGRIRLPIEG